jgi:hypothetical protein
MAELTAFERASFYTALHAYLSWMADGNGEPPVEILNLFESLGIVLPRKASSETAEYVKGFRAGSFRTDLNPTARASLPHHLSAFYNMAGYSTEEPADSILTMTAFAARLAIDAYTAHIKNEEGAEKLERLLHRFLNTHLIPTLKLFKPPEREVADAMERIAQLVAEDARYLAARLSSRTPL